MRKARRRDAHLEAIDASPGLRRYGVVRVAVGLALPPRSGVSVRIEHRPSGCRFVAFGALSSGRPLPAQSGSLGTSGSAPSVKANQVRTARPVGALLVARREAPSRPPPVARRG